MASFPKIQRWRLGVTLGPTARETGLAIGWAVLAIDAADRVIKQGEMRTADPIAAAVALWRSYDPRPPVELVRYDSDAAFAKSRFAREGGTRDEHLVQLARSVAAFREAGAFVTMVSAK